MATTALSRTKIPTERRFSLRRLPRQVVFYGLLVFGAFLSLVPFLWLMGVAFRPLEEAYVTPMPLVPRHLTLDNLTFVLDRFTRATSLFDLYRNSIEISGVTVALVVVCTAFSGYAFSRMRFPGRDLLFWVVTLGMWMPISTALPALYQMIAGWGLMDNVVGLILPYTGWQLALGNFIMRSAFAAIPKDLEDAATIDGASTFQLWKDVMLPLASSSLVTVAIFTFVPVWGEYLLAFTFSSSLNSMPISIGIRLLNPGASTGEWTFPVAATAMLISFLPPMLIYFGLQKWFTKGLMEGALKF